MGLKSALQQDRRKIRLKCSWIKIKTGRSLTSYYHRWNRFNWEEKKKDLLPITIELDGEKQRPSEKKNTLSTEWCRRMKNGGYGSVQTSSYVSFFPVHIFCPAPTWVHPMGCRVLGLTCSGTKLSTGCSLSICSDLVFSMGCKAISAAGPGASPSPSLTLMSAVLFLTHFCPSLFAAGAAFYPFWNVCSLACHHFGCQIQPCPAGG